MSETTFLNINLKLVMLFFIKLNLFPSISIYILFGTLDPAIKTSKQNLLVVLFQVFRY